MQGSVASLSQDNSSVQIGANSGEGVGDECGSDDDGTFEWSYILSALLILLNSIF